MWKKYSHFMWCQDKKLAPINKSRNFYAVLVVHFNFIVKLLCTKFHVSFYQYVYYPKYNVSLISLCNAIFPQHIPLLMRIYYGFENYCYKLHQQKKKNFSVFHFFFLFGFREKKCITRLHLLPFNYFNLRHKRSKRICRKELLKAIKKIIKNYKTQHQK